MNKNNIVTVDMLFSYWILLWVFLYILFSGSYKWIRYQMNPLLALWFGLLENIIMLVKLLYKHPHPNLSALQFLLVIIITKAIPIFILRNHRIIWSEKLCFSTLRSDKTETSFACGGLWKNDLIVLFLVFTAYNLYLLLIKNTNIFEIYDETEKSVANNENRTPLLALINR